MSRRSGCLLHLRKRIAPVIVMGAALCSTVALPATHMAVHVHEAASVVSPPLGPARSVVRRAGHDTATRRLEHAHPHRPGAHPARPPATREELATRPNDERRAYQHSHDHSHRHRHRHRHRHGEDHGPGPSPLEHGQGSLEHQGVALATVITVPVFAPARIACTTLRIELRAGIGNVHAGRPNVVRGPPASLA